MLFSVSTKACDQTLRLLLMKHVPLGVAPSLDLWKHCWWLWFTTHSSPPLDKALLYTCKACETQMWSSSYSDCWFIPVDEPQDIRIMECFCLLTHPNSSHTGHCRLGTSVGVTWGLKTGMTVCPVMPAYLLVCPLAPSELAVFCRINCIVIFPKTLGETGYCVSEG